MRARGPAVFANESPRERTDQSKRKMLIKARESFPSLSPRYISRFYVYSPPSTSIYLREDALIGGAWKFSLGPRRTSTSLSSFGGRGTFIYNTHGRLQLLGSDSLFQNECARDVVIRDTRPPRVCVCFAIIRLCERSLCERAKVAWACDGSHRAACGGSRFFFRYARVYLYIHVKSATVFKAFRSLGSLFHYVEVHCHFQYS